MTAASATRHPSAASRRTASRSAAPPPPSGPLRLGDVSFLNCAPLRWGLASGPARDAFPLASGSPEWLAEELLAGRLDIGPVSLVRFLRHADAWELLPGGLALGSDGPVHSCLLVSRVPPGSLDGGVIALSEASRSTALLARMLLEDAVGVRPVYHSAPQDPDAMLAAADAGVLIGDEALRLHASPPPGLWVWDTGALWRAWTGLPMVFAVWVVRREVARACPNEVRAAAAALTDAAERASAHPAAVAAAAAEASARGPGGRLPERVLRAYYRVLDYSLGDRQLASMCEFARRAAARGEIPEARTLPDALGGCP